MSVRRECSLVEIEPAKWYLVIAMREYGTISEGPAQAFGPFPSQEETIRYLDGEFSNPGGYSVYAWQPGITFNPELLRLISKATSPWRSDDRLVPSDPGFTTRIAPLIAYPIERGCFRDVFTGFVVESLAAAERLGYEIYDRSEAKLYASAYHHPDCSCRYCTHGREALSGSEY